MLVCSFLCATCGDARGCGMFSVTQTYCPFSLPSPYNVIISKIIRYAVKWKREKYTMGQEFLTEPRNVGVVSREGKARRDSFWGDRAKSFKAYLTSLSPSMISVGRKRNSHFWSESGCQNLKTLN